MALPRAKEFESGLAVLREGYTFAGRRFAQLGSDIFQTRMMLRPTVVMRGAEAARFFYDESKFRREGAAPGMLKRTLFGEGGVQALDGEAHRVRKALFMDVLGSRKIHQLVERSRFEWRIAAVRWQRQGQVVLLDEASEVLLRAVCHWAGVPLSPAEAPTRAHQMSGMIQGPGAVGPRHWRGRLSRRSGERWGRELIRAARNGDLAVEPGTALHAIATHRDAGGEQLDEQIASVELINIIRPTVAVGRYVMFLAHALREHPDAASKLRSGDWQPEWFIHEVRRYYPFFPFVAARINEGVSWHGEDLPADGRAVLDMFATNRDPAAWEHPGRFDPARFRDWAGDPFTLIPQGGGDTATGHRCPGEALTVDLMKGALQFLLCDISYVVPDQDLRISLRRMPAQPPSRFIIAGVRLG